LKGTQTTGKMSTSMGNTIRSILYARFIAEKCQIPQEEFYMEASGDDQIIFIESKYTKLFYKRAYQYVYTDDVDSSISKGLGQIAKQIDVYKSINGAEYLSCIFITNNDNELKMLRQPHRFLQATPFTLKNKKFKIGEFYNKNDELLLADAYNIRASYKGVAFYEAYADAIFRVCKKINPDYSEKNKHNDSSDSRSIDMNEEFHNYLYEQYGILQCDLDEYYEVLRNINRYEQVEISLIDKLNRISTHEQYDNTRTILNTHKNYTVVDFSKHYITEEIMLNDKAFDVNTQINGVGDVYNN